MNITLRKCAKFIFSLFCIALIVGGGYICFQGIMVIQNPIELEDIKVSSAETVIYDRNGEIFEVVSASKAKNTTEKFPETLSNAVVAVEDKRFFEHGGVDIARTGKVIVDTLINREFGAGGSTITQQLVKNVTGDNEVSVSRKIREVFYAVQLEKDCTKEQILTKYLNIIYLGKGHYGMTDACQAYFDKSPDELDLAEAAFMAAIIKSPETYINDLDRANDRKNLVLGYMLEQQMISNSEYEEACSEFVYVKDISPSGSKIYSWFTESALYEFATMYAAKYDISYDEAMDEVISGGYKIYSTVDPDLQSEVYALGRDMAIGDVQSATLVMNKNGEVIACSGAAGKKNANFIFNRAIQARRQPGSSIKPLAVYGPAFEENIISSLSVYTDQEISYGSWTPRNFYRDYIGDMSIRTAIAISNNTIPVQILNKMGPAKGIEYLNKMGFKTNADDNALTLAVGAVSKGYTLQEMASGYQAILNGGIWREPVFFTKIVSKNEAVIYNSKMQESKKVFSEDTAYILTDMLMSVVESTDGTAQNVAISGMEVAAKTGTTSNNRDKWCCAYNPEYVVVTWCGYDQGSDEVEVTSSYIQKHVREILVKAPIKQYTFDVPETVQYVDVCAATGLIANENCEYIFTEKEIVKTADAHNACYCEATTQQQPIIEEWWNNIPFDIFDMASPEEEETMYEEDNYEEQIPVEEELPTEEFIIE